MWPEIYAKYKHQPDYKIPKHIKTPFIVLIQNNCYYIYEQSNFSDLGYEYVYGPCDPMEIIDTCLTVTKKRNMLEEIAFILPADDDVEFEYTI